MAANLPLSGRLCMIILVATALLFSPLTASTSLTLFPQQGESFCEWAYDVQREMGNPNLPPLEEAQKICPELSGEEEQAPAQPLDCEQLNTCPIEGQDNACPNGLRDVSASRGDYPYYGQGRVSYVGSTSTVPIQLTQGDNKQCPEEPICPQNQIFTKKGCITERQFCIDQAESGFKGKIRKWGFILSGTGVGGLIGGAPTLGIGLVAGAGAGFTASKILWNEIVDLNCERLGH